MGMIVNSINFEPDFEALSVHCEPIVLKQSPITPRICPKESILTMIAFPIFDQLTLKLGILK